jgi:hypothetical protein
VVHLTCFLHSVAESSLSSGHFVLNPSVSGTIRPHCASVLPAFSKGLPRWRGVLKHFNWILPVSRCRCPSDGYSPLPDCSAKSCRISIGASILCRSRARSTLTRLRWLPKIRTPRVEMSTSSFRPTKNCNLPSVAKFFLPECPTISVLRARHDYSEERQSGSSPQSEPNLIRSSWSIPARQLLVPGQSY